MREQPWHIFFSPYVTIHHRQLATAHWKKAERLALPFHVTGSARRRAAEWHAAKKSDILFHAAPALMFDKMNCWHSEDTQVVYVCMEKASQPKLFPCMRTQPHRGRARLSQRNPWISIRNRCSFFFFFHCITLVIQHKLSSCLPGFQASSRLKLSSTPKALPTLLIFNCTLGEVTWNHWRFSPPPH